MSRRSEREAREMRAVTAVVDDVLANWGIELDDTMPINFGDQVANQIGDDEAVEYREVYGLLLDVGKEVFRLTGKVDAVGIPTTDDASEVLRLRAIIALAYSHHSWDGSALKGLLALGLEPPRAATHAHAHQWGPPIGRPRATVCTRCGATRSVIEED